ncbi:unnamed protein product [Nyctereutes procyonoides]|uniref:(raccoon dog) hypothetical protein n=1 Tax=Nyctereutes procyonoides TaxID=34880 RepID=A0A811YSR1_NYCPR|nr:unnamed protein product [Nyctereutes procyonoides]CAD7679598.1 unnamed protein product [Nyctereutes procyonoides]
MPGLPLRCHTRQTGQEHGPDQAVAGSHHDHRVGPFASRKRVHSELPALEDRVRARPPLAPDAWLLQAQGSSVLRSCHFSDRPRLVGDSPEMHMTRPAHRWRPGPPPPRRQVQALAGGAHVHAMGRPGQRGADTQVTRGPTRRPQRRPRRRHRVGALVARARGLQDPRLPSLPAPVLASWVFYQLRRQQGPRAAVHTGASVSCAHGDLSPPQLPGPGPDLRAHRPLPLPSAQGLWGRWPTLAGPTLGGAAGGAAGRSRPHSGAAMHSGWKPGWGARLVTWPGCSPHVSPAAASPAGCPATSPALPAVLAVPQRSRSACTLPAPEDNRHTPGGWAAGRGANIKFPTLTIFRCMGQWCYVLPHRWAADIQNLLTPSS